ncbi:MAG TPA: hypothetical protein VK272_10860 [Solirubrobacteraceae bacterium]|nr:hypothetical protein [Solirubrobacteraceae bacterium]
MDWHAWHSSYENPDSALVARLALIQAQVRAALDRAPPGPIRALSVCAGQGHDLIGVLARHPRRDDVRARLVELDAQNVLLARSSAQLARLDGVEVVRADASLTDSYEGAVPAELVLICGVFGNISAQDVVNTVENLPQLCAPEATVIWTRHRHPPDLVPHVIAAFERAGFALLSCEDAPPFAVGACRLLATPQPLRHGVRLFEFIGHRALWPHLSDGERAALDALFRPDASLVQLVEAVRALPYGCPHEDTVDGMLSEGRGTCAAKHLFLAQVLAERFPDTNPALLHRVYRLDRARAEQLYGAAIAESVPAQGLIDVHRYLTIALKGHRITLDATLSGEPWDGRSPLAPVCGPGQDFPAGADPDADMHALECQHCDLASRQPLLAARAAAAAPPA